MMAKFHVNSLVTRNTCISQVHSKLTADEECNKSYEKFALHVKIRSKRCPLSHTILQMEQKFEK